MQERITKSIQAWKGKMLTPAGREILLKSVVTAIPAYLMQCFQLPWGFIRRLGSRMLAFWWGDYGDRKVLHWVRKDILCLPKCMRGVGFRNLQWFNIALLAKQAWRVLVEPHSLWVKLIRGIYFPNSCFQNAGPSSGMSWFWRSL